MLYHPMLNENQRTLVKLIFPPASAKLRKHDPFDVLEAIFFIVYTGCQWGKLPLGYPPHKTVYYHYRSWSARGYLEKTLRTLVIMKRHESGHPLFPTMTVIDSQSVRTGLPHAVSGIDGGKRVKGIKRHIAVDSNGYPLGADITTANVHDSKGAERMMCHVLSDHKQVTLIKADMGYRGAFKDKPLDEMGRTLESVKSNYGEKGFVPVAGRWVVERTFSWIQTYRRLMRNYGQYLSTARHMTLLAMIIFMLRFSPDSTDSPSWLVRHGYAGRSLHAPTSEDNVGGGQYGTEVTYVRLRAVIFAKPHRSLSSLSSLFSLRKSLARSRPQQAAKL